MLAVVALPYDRDDSSFENSNDSDSDEYNQVSNSGMPKSAKPMPAQASRSSKNSPIPSAIKKTSSATQILPQQAQGMETNYCSL